jgi:hypothetical protein
MRRTAFRILLAVTVLATVAQAEARDPVTFPEPPWPLTLNGCGFPIRAEVVTNNEFQDVVILADGTIVTNITGRLVLRFTNLGTHFSIVRNVSGPTTQTDNPPDGSTGTVVGRGNNWFAFGPRSLANLPPGTPGLVFTSGLAVLQFSDGAITSFSLNGHLVNGCDLLNQ